MPPLKFEGRYGVSDPVVSDALADKVNTAASKSVFKLTSLTISTFIQLRRHFPPLQRESTKWTLIYSLEMHGISLNTLFDRAQRKGPCVLCLRDQWGNVFGAYLSESPYVRKGYYGTGTCFLWKQTPQPSDPTHIEVFKSTGRNEYYILSEGNFLSVGGGDGRYGLYVDSSLDRGHSEKCLTFENETLSGAQEFNCVGCELWGFKM
ncbi:TLD-domain-containing protein [Gonapodya prolifera JEL478]|uniref:Oxidation resistance protein 1 n=1 Tax=Gonapodya prolifera (strain JEL478) TaxID=1344416 RepID=A0A139AL79_GONPJ|nr:TLD-domain-containing protein [Gonapodya prolifera JEL478]|eukprot:KXS17175.1 TLD-domain-containing protein [Gonapodya prolifera JEL478]